MTQQESKKELKENLHLRIKNDLKNIFEELDYLYDNNNGNEALKSRQKSIKISELDNIYDDIFLMRKDINSLAKLDQGLI